MDKFLFSTLIFILGTFITCDINATENPLTDGGEIKSNTKKVILDLSEMSGEKVRCQIINEEGSTIFSEELALGDGTFKQFNLSQLDEGKYRFRLTNQIQVVRYNVLVNSNNVATIDNENVTFKPIVRMTQEKVVDVDLLSQGKNVLIELRNQSGEVVYQRNIKDKSSISKRLNLEKMLRGKYTVKVTVGKDTFYEYLSI